MVAEIPYRKSRIRCNIIFYSSLKGLHIIEFLIIPVFFEQLVMGASFYNRPFMYHTYLVSILDGLQTVCDSHCGTSFHQSFKGVLYQTFRFCIEGRSSLIEYKNRRILKDSTRDTDTLTLSAGESASAVADIGIVAILGGFDKLLCISYFSRFLHLLACSIRYTECDIIVECVMKQDCLLIDMAYQGTQIVQAEVLYIDAVNKHLSFVYGVITRYKVY